MTDTISLSCSKCGNKDLIYPGAVQANFKASDTIICAGCGTTGKYGSLMKSANKQVMDQFKANLRKLYK